MKKIPHLVFYDDACTLCSKEISHYRKLTTIHPIKWIPIHQDERTLKEFGFDKHELLKVIHVLRGDGVVVTGASAFATIWHSVKRYRFAAEIIYRFHLIPILNYFYHHFAGWRFKRQVCEI
jgi:predicted DCC family thiol-disulfide oxidoreductase YuxK